MQALDREGGREDPLRRPLRPVDRRDRRSAARQRLVLLRERRSRPTAARPSTGCATATSSGGTTARGAKPNEVQVVVGAFPEPFLRGSTAVVVGSAAARGRSSRGSSAARVAAKARLADAYVLELGAGRRLPRARRASAVRRSARRAAARLVADPSAVPVPLRGRAVSAVPAARRCSLRSRSRRCSPTNRSGSSALIAALLLVVVPARAARPAPAATSSARRLARGSVFVLCAVAAEHRLASVLARPDRAGARRARRHARGAPHRGAVRAAFRRGRPRVRRLRAAARPRPAARRRVVARRSALAVALATRLVPTLERDAAGSSRRCAAAASRSGRARPRAAALAAARRLARARAEPRGGDGGARLRAARAHARAAPAVDARRPARARGRAPLDRDGGAVALASVDESRVHLSGRGAAGARRRLAGDRARRVRGAARAVGLGQVDLAARARGARAALPRRAVRRARRGRRPRHADRAPGRARRHGRDRCSRSRRTRSCSTRVAGRGRVRAREPRHAAGGDRAARAAALAAVGAEHLADAPLRSSRAASCSASASRRRSRSSRELLLLDEPSSQLDRDAAEALFEHARAHGCAVVVAEQRPELPLAFADRVVFMRDGRIARRGAARRGSSRRRRRGRPSRARGSEVVRLDGVSFAYRAARRCSSSSRSSLRRGEVVALVGPNGAARRRWRSSRRGCSCRRRARRCASAARRYLPQDPGRYLVEETVLDARSRSPPARRARGARSSGSACRRSPSGTRAISRAASASASRIAAVLAVEPDLLVLDEPTRGVDPERKRELAALLRAEAPARATLVVTHDRAFAASVVGQD